MSNPSEDRPGFWRRRSDPATAPLAAVTVQLAGAVLHAQRGMP